ncbi:MAG: hypothetical protein ACODAF_04515, partial [Actinomycetota bacterium]
MSGHRAVRRAGGLLAAAVVGAVVARAVRRRLAAAPPGGPRLWERQNHRGATVTLAAGPAAALGA